MTPRRRAILIVALILLLIAIVVAVISLLSRAVPQQAAVSPDVGQEPVDIVEPSAVPEDFVNPLIAPAAAVSGSTAAQQMAELFAERYGSYSNQGDYQNLRDLLPVMTSRYRQATEAFLATADPAPGQTYEGVTSVKISTSVRSTDKDSAVIAVTLQQQRASGTAAPTAGYRTLRMELQRLGDDWRVDKAAWED